jgi:hypothetical protein
MDPRRGLLPLLTLERASIAADAVVQALRRFVSTLHLVDSELAGVLSARLENAERIYSEGPL